MLVKQTYLSPVGELILLANEEALLGVWFTGQKYELSHFENLNVAERENPVLSAAKAWLAAYFAKAAPLICPPLLPKGTVFQRKVWELLLTVPIGETITYGQIAKKLNCRSAQAIGGAVGRNPISILIPCHRVIGSQGQLTGYAGGLERKRWLLEHEGIKITG